MATTASAATHCDAPAARVAMDHKVHPGATIGFLLVLVAGLVFAGHSIFSDTQ